MVKKNNQRSLLITFDDGFKSNLTVAEKYLRRFKLNAIFFIPLKFALLKNKKENFFIKHNLDIKKLNEKMNNLDVSDIKRILKLNNVIGAHTFSHKNLKNIRNKKRLILKLLEVLINFKEFLKLKS